MNERLLRLRARSGIAIILTLVMLLSLIPIAAADDYEGGGGASSSFGTSYGIFWYGPQSETKDGIVWHKTGVVAFTNWDAALYMLGYTQKVIDDLSPAKKSKLMTESTGGDFYTFAQRIKIGEPNNDAVSVIPGVATVGLNLNSMLTAWYVARRMYGETYSYWSIYTQDLKDSAKDDADAIIKAGEEVGGGGGGDSGGNAGGTVDDVTTDIPIYYVGNGESWAGDESIFNIKNEVVTAFISKMQSSNKPYWAITIDKDKGSVNFWFSDKDFSLYYENDALKYFVADTSFSISNNYYSSGYYYYDEDTNKIMFTRSSLTTHDYGHSATKNNTLNKYVYDVSNIGYCTDKSRWEGSGGGGDDEPDEEPPAGWPNTPTAPSPPDVPTPDNPEVPDSPTPDTPITPNPWIPIPDDSVSITGEDFQDLIDALNEHCIHLQNSIQNNISQLWDLQSDFIGGQFDSLTTYLAGAFDWLGTDVIASQFNDLKSYLHELFEWLAEQLNFDVTVEGGQYDDTSVIYWLKQIWSKMGGGINTRPIDPIVEPDGWWDWLTQLLNNLAADLIMLGQDGLADIVAQLNNLRTKFPFSLPWDLAALLGLLVGVPICPSVDMPIFTITSTYELEQVGTMHITLEDYDEVWAGVRWIETLAFTVYLISQTSNLAEMVKRTVRPR